MQMIRSIGRLIIVFLLGLTMLNSTAPAAEDAVQSVEGIFYLDGKPVRIEIADGRITSIVRIEKINTSGGKRTFVAPGLIDNQVNGYMSYGFTDEGLTVDQIRQATRALWKVGVTTYLPTVITASKERLMTNFAILAKATHDPEIGSCIPGFHMEGPYINPEPGFRGAHNERWIRNPDWDEFQDLYQAAEGKIIEVSLAPEQEGAIEFIRKLSNMGIVVALAHHNGSADDVKQAADAGADISTHLGNGCANTIHRHNNPLWPQLAEDRLMASIIVDGFHLRPEEVRTFFKVKGVERTVLVSDVTQLAGMPPGEYLWDEKKVVLEPEGVIKFPAQDVLAGAASPVKRGVENIMRFTGCSLADAIHMASRNPARLNGLTDRGTLETGKRADIMLFTMDEEGNITVQKTILGGNVVYDAG